MTKLSASALARSLGRDRGTVSTWLRDGCPADLPGAVAWLEQRAAARAREPLEARIGELEAQLQAGTSLVSEDEARRRKRVAEAELRELELARKRGESIATASVAEAWVAFAGGIRSQFLGLDAVLADELAAASTPREVRAILGPAIRRVLATLANAPIRVAARSPGGDAESSASAGAEDAPRARAPRRSREPSKGHAAREERAQPDRSSDGAGDGEESR
jgi:phage terminase Nu1 subunit (DNA packaging protein)